MNRSEYRTTFGYVISRRDSNQDDPSSVAVTVLADDPVRPDTEADPESWELVSTTTAPYRTSTILLIWTWRRSILQ